ncbi:hypothetical protein Tco_1054714 [Tanacetum coccineum]|uniref:Uncharacterized protein n=1 Tax=Tanacetum coccineum TaxID=301880 RepID=A0ABQ5GXJ7_9ASTR
MAGVLRFATLLSLIYVGVLSLPAQRRSSRLWQWDQVLARNVPHGSSHSVSDIVDTFFKKSHPSHYLYHQVVLFAFNDTARYPDQGGDNKKGVMVEINKVSISRASAMNKVGESIFMFGGKERGGCDRRSEKKAVNCLKRPETPVTEDCVMEEIEKIRRSFFWGKSPGERNLCIIDWGTITRSKPNVGLGVGNLRVRNEALICK